jgi:hypothetical protein
MFTLAWHRAVPACLELLITFICAKMLSQNEGCFLFICLGQYYPTIYNLCLSRFIWELEKYLCVDKVLNFLCKWTMCWYIAIGLQHKQCFIWGILFLIYIIYFWLQFQISSSHQSSTLCYMLYVLSDGAKMLYFYFTLLFLQWL